MNYISGREARMFNYGPPPNLICPKCRAAYRYISIPITLDSIKPQSIKMEPSEEFRCSDCGSLLYFIAAARED
jgi:hypothetical protein